MRKIRIDNKLKQQVNDFNTNLFKDRKFKLPPSNLKSLIKYQKGKGAPARKKYIEKIINNYSYILNASPNELEKLIRSFNRIIKSKDISIPFHESIVKALRYDALRDKEFLEILQKLKINSCIYCNTQLTVVFNSSHYTKGKNKGKVKSRNAMLELDHFHPKSKYPFLSTSFFNLLPCCSYCNKSKSKSTARFYLYAEDNDLDMFSFKLTTKSMSKFLNTNDINDIEIVFSSKDKKLLKNHKDLFKIDEIYSTQKDIVEELLHKQKAYNNTYKSALVDNFKKLFHDKAVLNRLIIGNYDKLDEIHKRPMAKFTQDIARQLNLI